MRERRGERKGERGKAVRGETVIKKRGGWKEGKVREEGEGNGETEIERGGRKEGGGRETPVCNRAHNII